MIVDTGIVRDTVHRLLPWAWLYVGPDVFLPITSALAAIAGVALIFWQRFVGLIRKIWSMVTRRQN
ncbi:MAG TPA: hypothetical protein VFV78_07570 [Vicinamibacterales bacterium]|nr:hypothetical protein [Vicinamibacterales bacterium]